MAIVFPRYAGNMPLQFDRVITALLSADQFDDWLPDPIYYDDRLNDDARTKKRVQAIWGADLPAKFEVEVLSLPRASGKHVPAIALPLEIRICAHAVITAMASRISKALPRDKVYGFRFLRDSERMFDPPGQELGDLFELVARAAQSTRAGTFEILDMAGFNASARPELFVQTLQRCGARPDECNVLQSLAKLGGAGLPSIDDAFAFAYNFYLQPIDEDLMRRKHNFFRYRDEYFIFEEATRNIVKSGAVKLGLDVKEKGRSKNVNEVKDNLNDQLSRTNSSPSEVLLTLPNGTIRAVVTCSSFASEGCTDKSELEFERDEPAVESLFKRPTGNLVDAVEVLPLLRAINIIRRPGILLAPPFSGATEAFGTYRTSISSGRAWLHKAMETGIKLGSSWQAGWCATLLSDIGLLNDAEIQTMLRLIKTASMKESARAQARVALARSSSLRQDQFWAPPAVTTEYQRRSSLVASRHLARRANGAWKAVTASFGAEEPELVRHLETNIQGVS